MVTFYDNLEAARGDALALGLREKVLCFVVRADQLLVFEHEGMADAGVQVPAGGVEVGESPDQTAIRELFEESGLRLDAPRFLASYRWEAQLPERFTRQVCHAYAFGAPLNIPDSWTHPADGYRFVYRWAPLACPALDLEMDAALPYLSTPRPLDASTRPGARP